MSRDTTFRTLHDIGLAAWFGGSLFGVAGLNAAAEEAQDERTTARITSVGWAKWTPVNALAIGAHLVGGAGLLAGNRRRALAQKGASGTAVTKLALTGAVLAAAGYARLLGKKIEDATVHAASGIGSTTTSHADPSTTRSGAGSDTAQTAKEAEKKIGQAVSDAAERLPVNVRQAQQQLAYVQLAVPLLTGALVVLTSRAGEEQRPGEQLKGIARRAGSVVGLDV